MKKEEEEIKNPANCITAYNPLQIPPCLKTAEIHLLAQKVGNPSENPKTCPCCLKEAKESFSIFKFGKNVTNFGSTIPLYFHFTRFILGYFVISVIGNIFIAWKIAKLNYDFLKEKGKNPTRSLKLSFIFTAEFMEDKNMVEALSQLIIDSIPIDQLTNLFLIIYSFYFSYSQKKMYQNLKNNMKISASDYTVMIGNVHEGDSLNDIRKFVKDELDKKKLPMVEIVGMSKATFKGNLQILREKVEEKEDEIKALRKVLEEHKNDIDQKGVKIAEERIEEKREEIEELEKEKLEIVKKDLEMHKNGENCVVFLTLNSVEEKDRLLDCKTQPRSILNSLLTKEEKVKKYKIMEAPDPTAVKWESLGYPRPERTKQSSRAFIVILLTFPIFALIIFFVEGLRERIVRNYPENAFIDMAFGTAFMPLVVTILTEIYIQILHFLSKYNKLIDANKRLLGMTKKLILIYLIGYAASQTVYVIFETRTYADKISGGKLPGQLARIMILMEETYNFFFTEIFIIPISCLINPDYFGMLFSTKKARKALNSKKKFSTKFHFMTQKELNTEFTKPEIELETLYSDLTGCCLIIILMMSLVRTLPLFGILFIIIQTFVDKLQFYKWCKTPINDTYYFAHKMSRFMAIWVPRIYTVSRVSRYYVFKEVQTKMKLRHHIVNFVLVFFVLLPTQEYFEEKLNNFFQKIDIQEAKFCKNMKLEKEKLLKKDNVGKLLYKDAKGFDFMKIKDFLEDDYDRLNPLTRSQAEKRWRESRITLSHDDLQGYKGMGEEQENLDGEEAQA